MTRAETIGWIVATWLVLLNPATPAVVMAEEATPETRVHFNIPRQPADLALTQFAEQANLTLLFPTDGVQERTANELVGEYTLDEAIDILLAGTGLAPTFKNRLVLDIAIDDESTVMGEAMDIKKKAGLFGILAGVFAGNVNAQDSSQEPEREKLPIEEIVVTGTLIKGVVPKSSPVISIGQAEIRRSGYATIGEYLEFLPQNFANSRDDGIYSGGSNEGSSINLRGLGANETLTLINGRRIASASTFGSFVDINQIPVTAIDRIEILLDGASAIYGADAVAGVVNIILKKDQEGLLVSARYGTVTDGTQDDIRLSATGGQAWDSGNVALSYEYYDRSALLSDERDFVEVTAPAEPFDLIREQHRHSITLSASQSLSPSVTLSVDGIATKEDFKIDSSSFASLLTNELDSLLYALSGGLNVALWGFDVDFSAGLSKREVERVNRLETATNDLLREFDDFTDAHSFNIRASRPLADLPAGKLMFGFGASIREEEVGLETTDLITGSQSFFLEEGRQIKSVYGQINVPIFGPQNARPLLHDLELTLSMRADEYDNFGSSANPKMGVAWSPVEGLLLRGSYGTSFRAPEIRDLVGGGNAGVIDPEALGFGTPFPEFAPNIVLSVNGPNPDLEEQSSENFTVGIQIEPVSIPNLSLELGYFDIEYDGRIDRPQNVIGGIPLFTNSDPRAELFYIFEPSLETIQRFFDGAAFTSSLVPGIDPNDPSTFGPINLILDNRTQNIAKSAAKGIDFTTRYRWTNTAGDFTFSSNMSYLLENAFAVTELGPLIDNVDTVFNPVDLRVRSALSYRRGDFSSSFIVNYVDGYSDNQSSVQEEDIGSWTTLGLSAGYEFGASADARAAYRIQLSVSNLFDTDPPFVAAETTGVRLGYDPTNATPRGRFIAIEIIKAW